MNKELTHALYCAINAFHATLEEHGYHISYGLKDNKTGRLYESNTPQHKSYPIGSVTITWQLENTK